MQNTITTEYWHKVDNGKIQCDVCPRFCQLLPGQKGFCFVREASENEIVFTSYGLSSGFAIDPIEKKPLSHFLPGSAVLSFGTAGCNLGCKFCQNWDMSKSREMSRLASKASPENIAKAAKANNCKSVAFTYNDPVIFLEYAIDTAIACHEIDIKTVAVTAGYISGKAREDFFQHIDAANVDLKAFNDDFYWKLTGAHLEPVLETIEYIHNETNTWLELTTLLIPGENDSNAEIEQLTRWVQDKLGSDVPLHFSAFRPDWKMREIPPTSIKTLNRAREIASANGINYVYIGNVQDVNGASTYCPNCKSLLIERDGYRLGKWQLDASGNCAKCKTKIAGVFASEPGNWGGKYKRVGF